MLGETLAIGCALSWATSAVLFKRAEGTGGASPEGLNLFKNAVALPLLLVTVALDGRPLGLGERPWDLAVLAASGVVGIAVADTIHFEAMRRLGPGLLAIVEAVYAPLVVVLAVLLLGERPGPLFAIGATLVVAGVLTASERPRATPTTAPVGERWRGVAIGAVASGLMALAIVAAKPVLDRTGTIEATTARLGAGLLGQLLVIVPSRARGRRLRVLVPSRSWWTLLPASVLGAYVTMLFWIGGMKHAPASVAGVLNQLAIVFTPVIGRLVLGDPLTPRRLLGGATALVGAALVVARPL